MKALYVWIGANPVLATLAATAIVNAMPMALPGWRQIPAWFYGWFSGAARLFMNYRSGEETAKVATPVANVAPRA